MGFFRVLQPGMLSTVQDLGREGLSALGVPEGGAVDPLSLRIGNRLVGNPDGAPSLEMTLFGAYFLFEHPARIVLAGAQAIAHVVRPGAAHDPLQPDGPVDVGAGDRLFVGPLSASRAYLCIAGGLRIPRALGSASTHTAAAFGGLDGRALRKGDRLEFLPAPRPAPAIPDIARAKAFLRESISRRTIRAVLGAHSSHFDPRSLAAFWQSEFLVTTQLDRAGIRLLAPGPLSPPHAGRMTTEGMPWGAVQVPQYGHPIILLADHPTTGGYPVIACVATVDLPTLGQLRPGDAIRFEKVTPEHARELFHERERRLDAEVPHP